MTRQHLVATLSTLALIAAAGPLFAGPINPPVGPIGSTAKPLSDVEPRTAINAANTPGDTDSLFKITQPGSYYLPGNISGVASKSGIEIAASDVTLDLAGFRMVGAAGALSGIVVTIGSNIAIRNGTLRAWPGGGISAPTSTGCIIEDVRTIGNTGVGMQLGPDAMVRRCYSVNNTGTGILASVPSQISDCLVHNNGSIGISTGDHSTVTNSISLGNTSSGLSLGAGAFVNGVVAAQNSSGITASSGLLAENSIARNNTGPGFSCFSATFANCESTVNTGDGFHTDAAMISNCRSTFNGGNGYLTGNNSLVLHSLAATNTLYGIHAVNGYALHNLCTGDGTNNPNLVAEIYFDTRGRVDSNHFDSTNTSLWGVGGTTQTLMINNSLAGGFTPTFSGMAAPDVNSSTIGTITNPYGNFDLP